MHAGRSPTEEACAADAIVRKAKGEKAEAAAQLGWPLSKLDRGLARMDLAPQVLADLDRRTIRLPKFQVPSSTVTPRKSLIRNESTVQGFHYAAGVCAG